jgi:hypothetical protein
VPFPISRRSSAAPVFIGPGSNELAVWQSRCSNGLDRNCNPQGAEVKWAWIDRKASLENAMKSYTSVGRVAGWQQKRRNSVLAVVGFLIAQAGIGCETHSDTKRREDFERSQKLQQELIDSNYKVAEATEKAGRSQVKLARLYVESPMSSIRIYHAKGRLTDTEWLTYLSIEKNCEDSLAGAERLVSQSFSEEFSAKINYVYKHSKDLDAAVKRLRARFPDDIK